MAKEQLAKFCSEYLPRNPDLKASMDAVPDQRQFARAMVGAGSKAGFAFNEDDVLEVLGVASQSRQELTEDQLDAVAGGVKKQANAQSKTEYLTIQLQEVLISS